MQSILFYQLVNCGIFIAFGLFGMDQSLREINFDTFMCLAALICALIPIFIYCYHADGLSEDLREIGDIFFATMWYKLPHQEQKAIMLPIQRAQQIFRLNGYKIIDCSLGTFLTVNLPYNCYLNFYFQSFIQLMFMLIYTDNRNSCIILHSNSKSSDDFMSLNIHIRNSIPMEIH